MANLCVPYLARGFAPATLVPLVDRSVHPEAALFRKGNPNGKGKPSRTALVRHDGGWFGGTGQAPDLPMDTDVLTEKDAHKYAAALEGNGFFGPDSWYMNSGRNLEFAANAVNAASCSCRSCSCTGSTTTSARPSRPASRNPCDRTAAI